MTITAMASAHVETTFDLVVDVAGGSDGTVIQTVLDTGGNDFTAWVKAGTYNAGFTEASTGARIFLEPGTVVEAAITMSGADSTLLIGAGSDIQGIVTLSGANCSLICENGVDIDGVLMSGNSGYMNGGGWDTVSHGGTAAHALNVSGTDCVIENAAFQTTAGGGSSYEAINIQAAAVRTTIRHNTVLDSDNDALVTADGAVDCLIEGNYIAGADVEGFYLSGGRCRIVNNYMTATGNSGITMLSASSDDSVIMGNIVKDHGNRPIDIQADAENQVCVGNRTDGAVVDNSGTSTLAGNDETAF